MPARPGTVGAINRPADPDPRASAAERGYGARWRKTRAVKLSLDPLCEHCLAVGLTVAATDVDHKDGGGPLAANGHDLDNLQSLCKACHGRKSVELDGALGHRPRQPTAPPTPEEE